MAVVLISIVGTLVTDNLVDNFGVSLVTATVGFTLALIATFGVWYASERTLSIHSILTTRREVWYWLAILFTFALGTAAGDLSGETYGLGYFKSVLLYAALIALIGLAYWKLGRSAEAIPLLSRALALRASPSPPPRTGCPWERPPSSAPAPTPPWWAGASRWACCWRRGGPSSGITCARR